MSAIRRYTVMRETRWRATVYVTEARRIKVHWSALARRRCGCGES